MSCCWVLVTKPERDNSEIGSRLQQVHRRRVADRVRRNTAAEQRGTSHRPPVSE